MAPKQPRQQSLVAAATRVRLNAPEARQDLGRRQAWQVEAWQRWRTVPEIKQAMLFLGAAFSKLRLYVAADDPDDAEADPLPVDDPAAKISPALALAAKEELARLEASEGGIPELLRRLNLNLEIPGEAFLVGYGARVVGDPDPRPGKNLGKPLLADLLEEWSIKSTSQVLYDDSGPQGAKTMIRSSAGSNEGRALDPELDTIIRLFQADPEFGDLADSAMQGVLGECRILQALTNQQLKIANSQMHAGVMTLPNELSFAPMPAAPGDGQEGDGGEGENPFIVELDRSFTEPVDEPDSLATVRPMLIQGPAQYLTPDYLRYFGLTGTLDTTVDDRIEVRVRRIGRGLNVPVEVIEGMSESTYCVDSDTEAFTWDGWRRYDELAVGDLVLTIDPHTRRADWQPVEAVNRFDVVDEPVLRVARKAHNSVTSENHRWLVMMADSAEWKWCTSAGRWDAGLNTNHRVPTAASRAGGEQKWSDAWVELVAWFYTEGSIDRRSTIAPGVTIISQSASVNPGNVARIRGVLHELFGPPARNLVGATAPVWYETVDKNRPMARFRLSRHATALLEAVAPDRVVSVAWVHELTPAQARLFTDVSGLADGWTVNSGTPMFSQRNPARVDAYEAAVIASGRTPSRWNRPEGSGPYSGRVMHFCSITDRTTVQPITSHERGDWGRYSGVMWCPTTPNGTWLARRDGSVFFTGNSNASQVNQDTYEDYLDPRCRSTVGALTFGYLRPNLEDRDEQFDPAELARVKIWFDPKNLFRQPDPQKASDYGVEHILIRDESWRRENGYSESDAPDALETLIALAMRKGTFAGKITAAMIEAVAQEAGVELPAVSDAVPAAADGGAAAMQMLALALALRDRQRNSPSEGGAPVPFALPALTAAAKPGNDVGQRLVDIDRDLRSRLEVAANDAVERVLEKAGNRLRSKAGGDKALLADTPARLVASTLGRTRVTASADPDDLIGDGWDALEKQFMDWGAGAQTSATDVVSQFVGGMTGAERASVGLRQADDLAQAWAWMKGAIQSLTLARLFDPDPAIPDFGEFDPTLNVPTGLLRQAIARAGGASALNAGGAGEAWVTLTDSSTRPAGGIATGDVLRDVLREHGASVEAYRWDYGPAQRRAFKPHLRLSGKTFRNFDDEVLANTAGWPPYEWLSPGDHAGCRCDATPILIPPGAVV